MSNKSVARRGLEWIRQKRKAEVKDWLNRKLATERFLLNESDMTDDDASGYKNVWMDDFYLGMTRMIISL